MRVTCVEQHPEAIFNEILSATKHKKDSYTQEMEGKEDDPSNDETENHPTLKEDHVKCIMQEQQQHNAQACLMDMQIVKVFAVT